MAAVTSLVCNNKSNTEHERWGESFPVRTSREVRREFKIWLIILRLTTCTHSMSGSLTAWFPDRLTTQAGVSGVASSSAITASTPILLPWSVNTQSSQSQLVSYRSSSRRVRKLSFICAVFIEPPTRILSKAEGVPPLWTWPRIVVRVSKPSLSVTSCR